MVTGASLTLGTLPDIMAAASLSFCSWLLTSTHLYGWLLKQVGAR